MNPIRVLVVDDHPLMREALSAAIATEAEMQVVGEAASGLEAVELARTLQPDVIVMDLLMPVMTGVEAIGAIHSEMPDALILALTSSIDPGKVRAAVQAGALGYLLKDARREELLQAIREVSQGNPYLPPQTALKLMESMRPAAPPPFAPAPEPTGDSFTARLTARQAQVLDLLGMGLSDQEIARRLVVSEATVRSHIFHIQGRLGLATRSQLIAYAARQTDKSSKEQRPGL